MLVFLQETEGQGPVSECRTEQVAVSIREGKTDSCIIVGAVSGILLRSSYWKDSEGHTEQVPEGGRNSHTVFDPADLTSELGN